MGRLLALGALALLVLGAACVGGGGGAVKESPCEWGDNRPGCEQDKVQCSDPRNCY